MDCKFCSKECKNANSLRNHERLCKLNPTRQILKSNFIEYNKKVKNGELQKEYTNQYAKAKLLGKEWVCSEDTRHKLSRHFRGKKHKPETIEKIKVAMRTAVRRNPDSYTASNVSGRTPIIIYNGVKLKGSWEVTVAKWLDAQNVRWQPITQGIEYGWNNAIHLYYPDFYLPEIDYYVEVKGYERPRDRAKWKCVEKLIVIKHEEIKKIQKNLLLLSDLY